MTENRTAAAPPLDEVMLAMDVVDTLRHRERIVERALAADERDRELVGRLKEIYAGQGIEVSDAIIEQGVRDLREDRFAYTPPAPSFARTLARLYVSRSHWGPAVSFSAVVIATLLISYQVFVRAPALEAIEALPGELEQVYAAVVAAAEAPAVDADALTIRNSGMSAFERGDNAEARDAVAELNELLAALTREYEIRVRSAPGELSGVWRIPDANPQAQNFYLIVEAVDAAGERLRLPIVNEETGRTAQVRRWGQRVDEATFQAVADDKQDDGVIQGAVIGAKRRGVLEPEYRAGVQGGAITSW